MKRPSGVRRAALLLPLVGLGACGSISVQEGADGGGAAVGSAGAGGLAAGGSGGVSGVGGQVSGVGGQVSGAGGGAGRATGAGGSSNPDAATGKDSGASDGGTVDAVASSCMTGDRRCMGSTPQTCDANGVWQSGAACGNTCAAGACVGTCTPGAKMCVGNIPQYCDSQGLWQTAPACAYVCHQGDCTGVCMPGARQCSSAGVPQTCNVDGAWDSGAACPFVCSQGVCSGVCKPGDVGCNGNVPQTCSAAGDWQAGTTCPYVCTSGQCAGACTPGTHQCANGVPQTCSQGGVWQSGTACPYVCANGSCSGSCVPGDTQCTSGQKQICDATGAWQDTTTPPVQLFANPNLDLGHVSWVEKTLSTSQIITAESTLSQIKAQTSPNVGWLGGYANAQDDLYQSVTIPAGATAITLTFWYAIFTQENANGEYDTMDAYTYDPVSKTYNALATFSNATPASTWTRFSTDLPLSLAGQTFEVGFLATTNATKNTNFFVDTISLAVTACGP